MRTRSRPLRAATSWLLATTLLTAAASCSSKSAEAPCIPAAPAACPDAGAPSYANTIEPIVTAYCVPCHSQGGKIDAAAAFPIGTYDGLYKLRADAENLVNQCIMPYTGGPPLPEQDRVQLLTWLVCGAPDN